MGIDVDWKDVEINPNIISNDIKAQNIKVITDTFIFPIFVSLVQL